jgi:NTE family protein
MERRKTAIVLSGGGARGAYEVGVVRYLRRTLPRRLGRPLPIDLYCGTSVGAVNACFLAATCEEPAAQSELLAEHWRSLDLRGVYHLNLRGMLSGLTRLLGFRGVRASRAERVGGLVDARDIENFVVRHTPWARISENLARGHFQGLSVSATHVATGRTVVFVERRAGGVPEWSRDPFVEARAAAVGPLHALASAAIPGLFPAVRIDGWLYCDGGLRQNTPLSPALRLGADRVIVVALRHLPRELDAIDLGPIREVSLVSPFFLLGKALNAMLLDHIDYDLDRLRRFNALIEGGRRAFGAEFDARLGRSMGEMRGAPYRVVDDLLVRPSVDIGRLAAEFARSSAFRRRLRGPVGRLFRYLAEQEGHEEADLLSYLLFDGEYASLLIALGERDAAAREEQFLTKFGDIARERAASG